jgi:LysM repeat protein
MATRHLRTAVLACLVLSALVSGACTRSASTPLASAVPGGGTPQAENWQQQTMEAVRFALLTQTAQAASGTAGGTGATPTTTVAAPLTTGAPIGAATTPTTPLATAVPIVLATSTPLVRPTTYTLQEGEFPYCIARRFNVDPDDLLSASGLSYGDLYSPGTVLRIPQSGSFPGARALRVHPANYSVLSGNTIYAVACIYGDVDPMGIATTNALTAPYTLTPGTTIRIP